MIPTHWTPVHRPEDGEHVGYLSPDGPLVVPRLLAGPALAAALPPGTTDAGAPAVEWEWRSVVLVEVSPTTCSVRPEWPAPEETNAVATMPTPVGDLLREDPPDR